MSRLLLLFSFADCGVPFMKGSGRWWWWRWRWRRGVVCWGEPWDMANDENSGHVEGFAGEKILLPLASFLPFGGKSLFLGPAGMMKR